MPGKSLRAPTGVVFGATDAFGLHGVPQVAAAAVCTAALALAHQRRTSKLARKAEVGPVGKRWGGLLWKYACHKRCEALHIPWIGAVSVVVCCVSRFFVRGSRLQLTVLGVWSIYHSVSGKEKERQFLGWHEILSVAVANGRSGTGGRPDHDSPDQAFRHKHLPFESRARNSIASIPFGSAGVYAHHVDS